jgi:type III secretion system YscD/HrpQ family protein
VLLLAMLGGGTFWLLNQSSDVAAAHSPEELAQQIVNSLGANGAKVSDDGHGGLLVEGYVATNELQRRLRQALLDASLAPRYNVVSLEQQVTAIRTIVSTAGAKLTVDPDPATGKIVIEGFLPEMAHWDTLQRVLQRDVPGLRPIEAHIVTTEKSVAEARERLDAAGLAKTTRVEASGATVRISGAVPESQRGAVKRIAEELNANWARNQIKVEDATTSLAGPSPTPIVPPSAATVTVRTEGASGRFTIIVAGTDGFVRDNAGRRYGVGDKLANGEVIREIRADEVVTSRDGVKYRYTFGGR